MALEISSKNIDYCFKDEVNRLSVSNVNLCYQCLKCSAGCPVSFAMDLKPAQVIAAVRLGQKDVVYNSKTTWLCASCKACTTRCPQEIDIAKVMEVCAKMALKEGKITEKAVPEFYKISLNSISSWGRLYELGTIMELKLKTGEYFKDVDLGLKMFSKGKLNLLPPLSKGRGEARKIIRRKK